MSHAGVPLSGFVVKSWFLLRRKRPSFRFGIVWLCTNLFWAYCCPVKLWHLFRNTTKPRDGTTHHQAWVSTPVSGCHAISTCRTPEGFRHVCAAHHQSRIINRTSSITHHQSHTYYIAPTIIHQINPNRSVDFVMIFRRTRSSSPGSANLMTA